MKKVNPGDIVFSYKAGKIVAFSVVIANAYTSDKPGDFPKAGDGWDTNGWRVDVEYYLINNPIKPKLHIDKILPLLASKYAPLKSNGNGNQAYLFSITDLFAERLVSLMDAEVKISLINATRTFFDHNAAEQEEEKLKSCPSILETEKAQLVNSRRGQGKFRSNVSCIEPCCRLTKITDMRCLIASHIKPWSECNNFERLDGNNGLLLAPHIDHLFDKGFISFHDDGRVMVSSSLCKSILSAWSISLINVGEFNGKQKKYLEYHRSFVFDKFV